jgi:hypothetical protein
MHVAMAGMLYEPDNKCLAMGYKGQAAGVSDAALQRRPCQG